MNSLQLVHPGKVFERTESRNAKAAVKQKAAAKKLTFAELRAMARNRETAAWAGIVITLVVQVIVFSVWVGGIAERVSKNAENVQMNRAAIDLQIEKLAQEQKTQAQLVYGMPYLQQSVQEIKTDVKELKRLAIQGIAATKETKP